MGFLPLLAMMGVHAQLPKPLLWLAPDGQVLVAGRPVQPRITPGAAQVRLSTGVAYDFSGKHGGVLLPDLEALKVTDSITISVWLNLRSYVSDGPGAQVLFRGDDRCGVDPYFLVVWGDGTIHFAVQNADDKGMDVKSDIPLNRWVHVFATFDAKRGELKMWLDHEFKGLIRTQLRPFTTLDTNWAPGIGIGNVQNDQGPHNQPLDGIMADLRLYHGVFQPDDVDNGIAPGG